MPSFSRRPYLAATSGSGSAAAQYYRSLLQKHPFLFFGLPFISLMLAGSFFLTPATAVRFERFDRKTHMLDREEAMAVGLRKDLEESERREGSGADADPLNAAWKERKRFVGGNRDIREEYFRLAGKQDKLDDWEPKRVKRLPGEPDGTFE